MIGVNLRGSFLVAQAALRSMTAQNPAPGQGRLILIASELAHLGRADFAAYCASKAGVIGLTRSFAREFAPGILVNAVAPGPTDTPMLAPETMSAAALALTIPPGPARARTLASIRQTWAEKDATAAQAALQSWNLTPEEIVVFDRFKK